MATVVQEHAGPVAEVRSEPEPVQGGDPSILGVPIFVVGSIALGLSLVGYVPAAAGGIVVPVIFAATGVGLVIATIWAAALGQTMVASIFGLFAGFWLSFSILELGVLHNWLLIPAANVNKSVALFLISWAVIMAALTIGLLRLPVVYAAIVGLVTLALILRTIGVLNTDDSLDKAAGYVVLLFAALGLYVFLSACETATGGAGYPLGPVLRK
jgi:succinate-acetate transporter protein